MSDITVDTLNPERLRLLHKERYISGPVMRLNFLHRSPCIVYRNLTRFRHFSIFRFSIFQFSNLIFLFRIFFFIIYFPSPLHCRPRHSYYRSDFPNSFSLFTLPILNHSPSPVTASIPLFTRCDTVPSPSPSLLRIDLDSLFVTRLFASIDFFCVDPPAPPLHDHRFCTRIRLQLKSRNSE